MALTGLTGLHLHSGVATVPNPAMALQQSSQLLWLYEGGYTPVFDADAWPEHLRCARLTWRQVLQAPCRAGLPALPCACASFASKLTIMGLR